MKIVAHAGTALNGSRRAMRRDACAVDELLDSYVAWREACARLRCAYDCWFAAGINSGEGTRWSHAACDAALDQEEQAARLYQGWVERVGASARSLTAECPDATSRG
jgi:hypothetical protein